MEPGFTQIINPLLGPSSVSVVAESSLPQWYRAGWRLLADGDIPPAQPEQEQEPEPMTLAEAGETAKEM